MKSANPSITLSNTLAALKAEIILHETRVLSTAPNSPACREAAAELTDLYMELFELRAQLAAYHKTHRLKYV